MKTTTFDVFYRAYYNSVLRYIERRIDPDVAADLCAQCFEIAWKKFDEADPFGLPWMYQTSRNLLGNAYRRRTREQRLVERAAEAYQDQADGDDRAAEVRTAMWRLSARDREALQLTYWEGLSAAEVGQVLSCSEQAAWKRISRAKKKLRDSLEPRTVEEEGVNV